MYHIYHKSGIFPLIVLNMLTVITILSLSMEFILPPFLFCFHYRQSFAQSVRGFPYMKQSPLGFFLNFLLSWLKDFLLFYLLDDSIFSKVLAFEVRT